MRSLPHFAPFCFMLLLAAACRQEPAPERNFYTVRRQPLTVESVFEGTMESRNVHQIASTFSGGGVIAELVPDGKSVQTGDTIVRFDDAQAKREMVRAQRDASLARVEKDTMEKATIPQDVEDLEKKLAEVEGMMAAEKSFLADCEKMLNEGMLEKAEVADQQKKVARAEKLVRQAERDRDAFERYVKPARLERAQATLSAAEQELEMAKQQVESCTMRAPTDGAVVHLPVQIGAEYRTARVGDTVMRNQPFLAIPDVTDWVVAFFVPEAEISRVQPGCRADVRALAYPNLVFSGAVETVSAMTQEIPGTANWQKHFRVSVSIKRPDGAGGRALSGLTAQVHVIAHEDPQCLTVPRASVRWVQGKPVVQVRAGDKTEDRPVRLGWAGAQDYEVLEGVREGDQIAVL